jgi:hypothetical protein
MTSRPVLNAIAKNGKKMHSMYREILFFVIPWLSFILSYFVPVWKN